MKEDARTVVFHIGDHDDKGVEIFDVLADDVTQFIADYLERGDLELGRVYAEHIVEFVRLAITDEQIHDHDFDLDGKDQGYDKSGMLKVQAEAIPLGMRAQLIEGAIESVLDLDLFDRTRQRAEAEREALLEDLTVPPTAGTAAL